MISPIRRQNKFKIIIRTFMGCKTISVFVSRSVFLFRYNPVCVSLSGWVFHPFIVCFNGFLFAICKFYTDRQSTAFDSEFTGQTGRWPETVSVSDFCTPHQGSDRYSEVYQRVKITDT
jgi:hypothetical protein